MENFLYPTNPTTCINSGPSECGKSEVLINLVSIIFNEFDKLYIYSPSLHQDLYQK